MHDNAGIAGDEFINKRRVAEEVRENLLSKGVSNQEATRSAIRIANNKPKNMQNEKSFDTTKRARQLMKEQA
jgi:hypothetical protein